MFSFRTKAATAEAEEASKAVFTLDDIRDIVLAFPRAKTTGLSIGKSSQSLQETKVCLSLQDTVLPVPGQHGSADDNVNNLSNSATDDKDDDRNVEKAERLGHETELAKMNKAIASAAKHGFLRLSDISNCFESREKLEEFLRKDAEISGRRKQFEVFGEIAVPMDQLVQMAKRWAQLATKYGVSHVKVSLILSCKCNQPSTLLRPQI